MPRTRRVDCSGPGIHRVGRGRGFSYHEEDGERITDRATLERVRGLAIPPAWKDVWICSDPRGHVQATGYDGAGRKQYVYHQDWRAARDREKFEAMTDFARSLPGLRERVAADLGTRGLGFERVCACAVALLDLGLFRVGNEQYEAENQSYGLTTLLREHLSFEDGEALFEYPSKSGQTSRHQISDPSVQPTLKSLARQVDDGERLLSYRSGRERRALTSDQVNAYIKESAGEEFSAKDFRTWNATVLAAVTLAVHEDDSATAAARRRVANLAVRTTAEYLNNTPAICRASYIDPRVFDRFNSGETVAGSLEWIAARMDPGEFPDREAVERAVLRLLD